MLEAIKPYAPLISAGSAFISTVAVLISTWFIICNTFASLSGSDLRRSVMNSTNSPQTFSDVVNNNRFRFLRKYF